MKRIEQRLAVEPVVVAGHVPVVRQVVAVPDGIEGLRQRGEKQVHRPRERAAVGVQDGELKTRRADVAGSRNKLRNVAVENRDRAVGGVGDGINGVGIGEPARELAQIHVHGRVGERDAMRVGQPVEIILQPRVAGAVRAGIVVVRDVRV